MTGEQQIWRGTPSHLTKIFHYILSVILSVVGFLAASAAVGSPVSFIVGLIPLLYALYVWFTVRTTTYELTTQRLRTIDGIFSIKTDELELYRIKDYQLDIPFWYRMFSLANITLITSDSTSPTITLKAIKNGQGLLDEIRSNVEVLRAARGVRELDMGAS